MSRQSLRFKNSDAGGQNTEKLLNRPAPLNPPDIKAAPTDLPIDVTPTTIGEIITATKPINSGKATGLESIPTEVLKSHVKVTAKIIHVLFKKILKKEQILKELEEGCLIKILKKGVLRKREN
ncbi:unnamed protein product [Schistosoma curassoni]|uniref:Uncharacterized protein n=1 Tax=Schistosoma curassoni TaxID=6186 RepID=A0A183JX04_9TREM|nr:unnamed protein product [Schistosoma curassoni]